MDPERFEFWRWTGEIILSLQLVSVVYYIFKWIFWTLLIMKYGIPLLALGILLCLVKFK